MDTAHPEPHTHAHREPGCPQCLVSPKMTRSAKFAWTVAGIAIVLLLVTFYLGIGSKGGIIASSGGLFLLAALACPVGMGVMMWMMMRMGNKH